MTPRALVVPFTKMNGAGNDFVVLDNRFFHFGVAELSALARRFCPRRTGIGADGLLALEDADAAGADFRMRYYNADGSLGTMCGNGARCLARFAHEAGIAGVTRPEGGLRLAFDTDGGRYTADVAAGGAVVRLHVPPPRDFGPVALETPGVEGETWRIWTGTEHAVRFVSDVATAAVATEGPAVRHDAALAPAGANANFVEVVAGGANGGPARLRARTFEKGVEAETLACGTGALASAVVARLSGRLAADEVVVEMPGGVLHVGFHHAAGAAAEDVTELTLEGPAERVFEGTLEC